MFNLKNLVGATAEAKVQTPSIAINVPADSPMAKDRMAKRMLLICGALQKEGLTPEREEDLMDELMARRYALKNLGIVLSRDPLLIPAELAAVFGNKQENK